MKKKIISLILICISAATFIGCGSNNSATTNNSNTQQQENKFDEEKAKTDSKAQLEKFLKVSENKTVIAKNTEMEKLREYVKDNLFTYMTKDFQTTITNELSNKGFSSDHDTFFLSDDKNTTFYNAYKMYSPEIDKENQTVTYRLESNGGLAPVLYVMVEMKQEDGTWKINKTSDLIK